MGVADGRVVSRLDEGRLSQLNQVHGDLDGLMGG